MKGSDILDRISTAFIETLAKAENLKLWSFAEEKQIRWGPIGVHIVSPESAKIGHGRENWGTISGNHRQIAKYSKATDEGFVKVSNVLKGWIDEVLFTATAKDRHLYEDYLKSLNDPAARLRVEEVSQVSRVNQGSFEWLFTDKVAYAEWLADDGSLYDPIFWITGKPGSGKSTLTRFALEDPRSESLLPPSIGHPLAYFFHLRGKSLVQKTLQGMMQELLYQILKQFPDFFVSLKPIYEKAISKTGHEFKWDLDDLIEGFSLIPDLTASSVSGRPRIFLFIDALDENQDQKNNEKLVRVLKDIVGKYQVRKTQPRAPLLKICLASRPWPLFRLGFGGQSRIPSIAVNEFTAADIKSYTQSLLLKPLSGILYSEQYQQSVLNLAESITVQAQGVFVWVRVVVDNLCQHIVDGTPVNLLGDILTRYPSELDELYEYTIRRIPKQYRRETEVVLKVVQQSRIQLNLGELYSICLICTGSAASHNHDPSDVPASWLASRCGGLIETTSQAEYNVHQPVAEVQFIHQTVQDFVRQGIKGISDESNSNLAHNISGSQFLAFTCRFKPYRAYLRRVYKDLFGYLRDIERAMDLAFSAQSYEPQLVTTFPKSKRDISFGSVQAFQDAFDINAHDPSGYDSLLKDVYENESWGFIMQGESILHLGDIIFAGICPDNIESFCPFIPILENLYYFGREYIDPTRWTIDYALIAALGPRTSASRTDRPRMLAKSLIYLPDNDLSQLGLVSKGLRRHYI
ncbi:hypothetical protein F4782DRAFT_535834 [Xylaria castorea]|nr:hypothetical protein F4782DRAFT_535834 [Xylaria castorea]